MQSLPQPNDFSAAKPSLNELVSHQTTDTGDSCHSLPQNTTTKRPKYQVITDDAREKLIDLVVKEGKSMQEAANECNINVSTAKGIVQVYMKEGRVGKKKTRDRTTNIITNVYMASANPMSPNQSMFTPLMTTVHTQQTSSRNPVAAGGAPSNNNHQNGPNSSPLQVSFPQQSVVPPLVAPQVLPSQALPPASTLGPMFNMQQQLFALQSLL